MKMYHIGLLPGRRCGTFFTENISDTFLSLIRHFAACFVLKNVKRKNGGRKMPLRVIYGTLTVL